MKIGWRIGKLVHRKAGQAVLLAIPLWFPASPAAAQERLALLFGNRQYQEPQTVLPNTHNDVDDLEAVLRQTGFDVNKIKDANLQQMKVALDAFAGRLAANRETVGLLFFGGHGVIAGTDGQQFLLPVGYAYQNENDVHDFAMNVRAMVGQLERAGNKLNIIILDACRDRPLPVTTRSAFGTRSLRRNPVTSGGTVIAYAAAPGQAAMDIKDMRNGLYTHHLLGALKTPGLTLGDVFNRTRERVRQQAFDFGQRQTPEEVSRLNEGQGFYFLPPVATAAPGFKKRWSESLPEPQLHPDEQDDEFPSPTIKNPRSTR